MNSKANQVVLDASYLRPGVSKKGSLTITGGGTLTGAYSAEQVHSGRTPGQRESVQHPDSHGPGCDQRRDDPVSGNRRFDAVIDLRLGSIAPGATRTYRFSLLYPAASANTALEGATMALRLTFTGVAP